jgi:hypothetical protein
VIMDNLSLLGLVPDRIARLQLLTNRNEPMCQGFGVLGRRSSLDTAINSHGGTLRRLSMLISMAKEDPPRVSMYALDFAAHCYGAAERCLPGYDRECFLQRARKWEEFASGPDRGVRAERRELLARVHAAVSPIIPDSNKPIP